MNMKKAILYSAIVMTVCSSCSLFEKKVMTEAVLPTDRETVKTATSSKPYRSQLIENGNISGDWVITNVAGIKPQGDEVPFIKFDNSTGNIYGNNGCNSINGNYRMNPADSTMTFSNLLTTMRYCQIENNSDVKIVNALNEVSRYSWEFKSPYYTLTFANAEGSPLMTLVHQDYDFLNGTWRVAEINGKTQDNPDMKLVFDLNEMKLHGNTGCNILNGSVVVDMSDANSLSFQQIATTRRACPDFESETALTMGLENIVYVKPVNVNTVELLDNNRHVVLLLKRCAD